MYYTVITFPSKLHIYAYGNNSLIFFNIFLSFSYFLQTNIHSIRFAGIPNKIALSLSVKKISLWSLLGTKKLSYTSGCTNSLASFNDMFSVKISHCLNSFAYLFVQFMIIQIWRQSWAKLGINLDSFVCSIVQVFAHIFSTIRGNHAFRQKESLSCAQIAAYHLWAKRHK